MPSVASRFGAVGHRHAGHHVNLPGEQRGNLRRRLGDDLEDDAVNLRPAAVIIVPSLEDVAIVLAEFNQRVRAGADGVAVELFLADFFKVSGRDQLTAIVADVIFKVGMWLFGGDIDSQVIHDDDFLDECPLLIERDIADRVADAVDIPLDGIRHQPARHCGRYCPRAGGSARWCRRRLPSCEPLPGRNRRHRQRGRSGSRNRF